MVQLDTQSPLTLRGPDGPWLRLVKAIARDGFSFVLRTRRWWARRRGQERWTLGGDCRQCAACCERPSIQVDRLTWHLRFLRQAFLWWQRRVNGFELVDTERPRVFVFRCRYFDWKARRCTSYESRPGICRDYPRFLLETPWPEFLPGCGYRAISRRGGDMLVALNAAGLSEAKREELKRRLRLE